MRYALALLFLIFRIPGCEKDDYIVKPGVTKVPATVDLRPGQSVVLTRERLSVTFDRITAESRCPIGLKCIWAGDAAAKLIIKDQNTVVRDCTLHTTLDPKFVDAGGISVRLTKVAPYPVRDSTIRPADYIVTLDLESTR